MNLFTVNLPEMKTFTSASIKTPSYKKLSRLAEKEKHTISVQLDIILQYYVTGIRNDETKV